MGRNRTCTQARPRRVPTDLPLNYHSQTATPTHFHLRDHFAETISAVESGGLEPPCAGCPRGQVHAFTRSRGLLDPIMRFTIPPNVNGTSPLQKAFSLQWGPTSTTRRESFQWRSVARNCAPRAAVLTAIRFLFSSRSMIRLSHPGPVRPSPQRFFLVHVSFRAPLVLPTRHTFLRLSRGFGLALVSTCSRTVNFILRACAPLRDSVRACAPWPRRGRVRACRIERSLRSS